MIRFLGAYLMAMLTAATLLGQTVPVWIWPEGEHLMMLDSLGNKQPIGTIPASKRYDPATATVTFANAALTNLEQRGEDWHLICHNGDAIYYLLSRDSGAHWITEEVDHIRHYQLMAYHPGTDSIVGPHNGITYMGFGGVEIALDPKGQPHVAYTVSGGNYNLDCFAIYAHREKGKWITEKVLTAQGYPKKYLGNIALDVDSRSVPHVLVHSHEQANTAMHSLALFSKAGGKWTRKLVSNRNTNGTCMEMAIDSKGGFHAVATAENVAYYWFSNDHGMTWREDSLMSGNCRFDLVLDSHDQPHLAGSCYTTGVYYGARAGGSWQIRQLEARAQMCHAKAIITPEGQPWAAFISHYYGDADVVVYKHEDGGWKRETALVTKGNRGSSVQPLVAFVARKPPVNQTALWVEHEQRPSLVQDTMEVRTEEVEISVSDYQRIDGDTISVSVNGKWVMEKVALTGTPTSIKVRLAPGANSIEIYAWNEGLVPPNTAILKVRSGQVEKTATLKCTLRQNAGVTLVLQE
jgi:hypothetical protein